MIGLAAGVLWVGYTLAWWGRQTLAGCTNVGFADLVIPGRYTGCTQAGPAAKSKEPALTPAPAADRQVGGTYKDPGTGKVTTSPPSSEGYFSRVPSG